MWQKKVRNQGDGKGWALAVLIPIEQIAEAAERARFFPCSYRSALTDDGKLSESSRCEQRRRSYTSFAFHAAEKEALAVQHVILFVGLVPKMNKDGTASKVILDLDNRLKVAVDALQGVVYHNDNQVKFILSTYSGRQEKTADLILGLQEG